MDKNPILVIKGSNFITCNCNKPNPMNSNLTSYHDLILEVLSNFPPYYVNLMFLKMLFNFRISYKGLKSSWSIMGSLMLNNIKMNAN